VRETRAVTVWNLHGGRCIAHSVEIADSSLSRAKGLLGRKSLHEGTGLWIRPCSGVHTFGMAFAIDVIGLDRAYKVVKLWPDLRPHRMTMVIPSVRSVLEFPAGSIQQSVVQLGDVLHFQE
jgi:uncharacterized membrane protein (UPF0127 family)